MPYASPSQVNIYTAHIMTYDVTKSLGWYPEQSYHNSLKPHLMQKYTDVHDTNPTDKRRTA